MCLFLNLIVECETKFMEFQDAQGSRDEKRYEKQIIGELKSSSGKFCSVVERETLSKKKAIASHR